MWKMLSSAGLRDAWAGDAEQKERNLGPGPKLGPATSLRRALIPAASLYSTILVIFM